MAKDRVLVKIQAEMGSEDAYFKEQDQKIIKDRRENAAREATTKYRDEHKNHCFRCGTDFLVEVDRVVIKIDLCVNEDCGALHLDPGELEQILTDKKGVFAIRKSLFAVFKK